MVEANTNAICRIKLPKLSGWAVSNLLTDSGRVQTVYSVLMVMTVNLLICERGGALYSVHDTV